MKRRDAIKLATATALGGMLSRVAFGETSSVALAENKSLRVLILGGTGFIGPHFVEVLRAGGHTLTLFNRGRRNPGLFQDIETLIGDRDGKLAALRGRDWDVVIDDSGYVPRLVQLTADLLKEHVRHYIFVSSISAYADLSKPGIAEDHPLATLPDPTVEKIDEASYGGLKALCEAVVVKTYGSRSAIIRPSYIVGPGDTSDRFTYWPVRVSRGGDMLAPGTPGDPIQFIDARDLADFMRLCVERRIAGSYNLCNPPRAVTMGQLLETSRQIAKSTARLNWAEAKFIQQHGLVESGEIPIWAPPTGESAGAALISSSRAVAQGLRFRSLQTTVADTLAWHSKRPEQPLRAGLSAQRETELLDLLNTRKG